MNPGKLNYLLSHRRICELPLVFRTIRPPEIQFRVRSGHLEREHRFGSLAVGHERLEHGIRFVVGDLLEPHPHETVRGELVGAEPR
jgi:hypothetical protein